MLQYIPMAKAIGIKFLAVTSKGKWHKRRKFIMKRSKFIFYTVCIVMFMAIITYLVLIPVYPILFVPAIITTVVQCVYIEEKNKDEK